VAFRAATLADARAMLDRGNAFAVVGIPPGTERDVLKGTTVHIPIYADATYMFIFRTTGSGIAVAINTLSSELAAGGARTDGSLVKATLASASPADILRQCENPASFCLAKNGNPSGRRTRPPDPPGIRWVGANERIPFRFCRAKNGNPSLREDPAPRRPPWD
jgi:hypothetical protein